MKRIGVLLDFDDLIPALVGPYRISGYIGRLRLYLFVNVEKDVGTEDKRKQELQGRASAFGATL
jgi:hypothetical protein